MKIVIDATPLLVRSAGVKSVLYHWLRALRRSARGESIATFPAKTVRAVELVAEFGISRDPFLPRLAVLLEYLAALYPHTYEFSIASDQRFLDSINVTAAQTQAIKGVAWMTLTVEVNDAARLTKVLSSVAALKGVVSVRRK